MYPRRDYYDEFNAPTRCTHFDPVREPVTGADYRIRVRCGNDADDRYTYPNGVRLCPEHGEARERAEMEGERHGDGLAE